MNRDQKKAILDYIQRMDPKGDVVESISPDKEFSGGKIKYNESNLLVHRDISSLGDEEWVRAFLLVRLVKELGYNHKEKIIEIEKTYSIGRPSRKSARVDILVKYPSD